MRTISESDEEKYDEEENHDIDDDESLTSEEGEERASDEFDEFHLFDLCKEASEASRNPNFTSEAKEIRWDKVREWFDDESLDEEERFEATEAQGEQLTSVLHMVCQAMDPPSDIIEDIIEINPDLVITADAMSWLPLHYVCANGSSPSVIDALIEQYPESRRITDKRERTALHFFLGAEKRVEIYDADVDSLPDVVRMLSEKKAVKTPDENGMLPLHYACAYGASTMAMRVLMSGYPEGIFRVDKKGRTPLHYVMGNATRDSSPQTLHFLLEHDTDVNFRIINRYDRDGKLAIGFLVADWKKNDVPADPPNLRDNCHACLRIYLDALPMPTPDLLTALQSLPDWLRETAVSHHHIQAVLNIAISHRFPTSILLLDGFFLCLTTVCLYLASDYALTKRCPNTNPYCHPKPIPENKWFSTQIAALFVSCCYFITREVIQILATLFMGSLTKYLSGTNLLNILFIVALTYYTEEMYFETNTASTYEFFRVGIILTNSIAWFSIIVYLKSTYVDFSVFVGGVLYIVSSLLAFLLAFAIVLIAFTQIFLIMFQRTERCPTQTYGGLAGEEDGDAYFPHCTFWRSLFRTYVMVVSAVDFYTDNYFTLVVMVIYSILVLLVLGNILIAMVSDIFAVISNERAAMVFWSNRLDFITEIMAIKYGPWRRRLSDILEYMLGLEIDSSWEDVLKLSIIEDDKYSFRHTWEDVLSVFTSKHTNLFRVDFWYYSMLRMVYFGIILLWIFVGAITAGSLWPPQIREYLFIQRVKSSTMADLEGIIEQQIKDLHNEISSFRENMKERARSEKKEIAKIKEYSLEVKDELLVELIQVKEMLSVITEDDDFYDG